MIDWSIAWKLGRFNFVESLTHDSVALCEQIRVIDTRRIIRVLGHIDDIHLEEIARALRTILGL